MRQCKTTPRSEKSVNVSNISYISHLLTQKNNQLKISSMTDFARSKRRLMSMESQYSIDNMLNKDTFTRTKQNNNNY